MMPWKNNFDAKVLVMAFNQKIFWVVHSRFKNFGISRVNDLMINRKCSFEKKVGIQKLTVLKTTNFWKSSFREKIAVKSRGL